MRLTRRRLVALVALAIAVALVGTGLVVLPEIVRRVVVKHVATVAERGFAIEDVDLNLFTGRLAVKGLRLAKPGSDEAAVSLARLDVRIAVLPLVRRQVRIREVVVQGLAADVRRIDPLRLDLQEVLDRFIAAGEPEREPKESRWVVTLERFDLRGARIRLVDIVVPPPGAEWVVEDLSLEAADLTTRPDAAPGRAALRGRLNGSPLALVAERLRLRPRLVAARLTLDGFELRQVAPYLPPAVPAEPRSGRLALDLSLAIEGEEGPEGRATLSGEARLDGLGVALREREAPFWQLARGLVKIARADLLGGDVSLEAIEAQGLALAVARDREGRIDLVEGARPRAPAEPAPPAPAPPVPAPVSARARTIRVERVAISESTVTFVDEAVTPRREWKVSDLAVDAGGLSMAPDAPAGRLAVRAQVGAASVAVDVPDLRPIPLAGTVKASLARFDLTTIQPYLPADLGLVVRSGVADLALELPIRTGEAGIETGVARGRVGLARLAVARQGAARPFVEAGGLTTVIASADLPRRAISLGEVTADGLVVRAARAPDGTFDLATIGRTPAGPAPATRAQPAARDDRASPPAKAPGDRTPVPGPRPAGGGGGAAAPAPRLSVARLALRNATVELADAAVDPATTLAVSRVDLTVRDFTWPVVRPARVETTMTLPGDGRLEVKGSVRVQPFEADLATVLRDAPIEPYQPYIPVQARLGGKVSLDVQSQIALAGDGLRLAAKGRSSIDALEILVPDGTRPAARVERIEATGVDVRWPGTLRVDRVRLLKPDVLVERQPDGTFLLRTILRPAPATTAGPSSSPPAARTQPPAAGAPGPAGGAGSAAARVETAPLAFSIGSIEIEEGYARFLDRTTTPAFSQTVASLAVRVQDLSNTPGQHARLSVQGLFAGDARLDLRGDIAPLSGPLFLDVVGDLKGYRLPSVNPYASRFIAWLIRSGTVDYKLHYTVQENVLRASNEIVVQNLEVAPSGGNDEVKARIGVPLGLIVALIKDSKGDIRLTVPVTGPLNDPRFDWKESIWRFVRNVVVNVLAAPFRAIGRLFTRGDRVEAMGVNPVVFSAGSAVVAPAMERHLTSVGDFLRAAGVLNLRLSPVGTAQDVEALKAQELTARVQRLQQERGLSDLPAAVAAEFALRFPGTTPPEKTEDQVARLVAREPVPELRYVQLLTRRAEVVVEALTKGEGIPAGRLAIGTPVPEPTTEGEPRVQFEIVTP